MKEEQAKIDQRAMAFCVTKHFHQHTEGIPWFKDLTIKLVKAESSKEGQRVIKRTIESLEIQKVRYPLKWNRNYVNWLTKGHIIVPALGDQ